MEADADDGVAVQDALRELTALRRLVLPLAVMRETLVGAAVHRLAHSRSSAVAAAAAAAFALLQADVRAAVAAAAKDRRSARGTVAASEPLADILCSDAMSMFDAKQGDLDAEMTAWEAIARSAEGERRVVAQSPSQSQKVAGTARAMTLARRSPV